MEPAVPCVDDDPPAGYHPMPDRPAIEAHTGPFYQREIAPGRWQMGFRVTTAKLNPMGFCHGGVLATFADAQGAVLKLARGLAVASPTVNLTLDYVDSAPEGAWVWSEPDLVRETGTLLFFQSLLKVEDRICVRVSGIYRLQRKRPLSVY